MTHFLPLWIRRVFLFSCLTLSLGAYAVPQGVDLDALGKQLGTTGVNGWIHGAVPEYDQYVFEYRVPGTFFTSYHFPMVPKDNTVKAQLAGLHRHDRVVVKGEYVQNRSPQKHILVSEVRVLERYSAGTNLPPRPARTTQLPAELRGQTELVALVHAVAAGGRVLVLDYKDAVIPVLVGEPRYAEELYRGDKVRLKFTLAGNPARPSHLVLNTEAAQPLEVLERIVDQNGRQVTLEGVLARFPRSPSTTLDVYAVQVTDSQQVVRNYFMVNFDRPTLDAIYRKTSTAWNAHLSTQRESRNFFINPQIRVRVRGTVSVMSPNQGEPQVLLDGPDDVEILN